MGHHVLLQQVDDLVVCDPQLPEYRVGVLRLPGHRLVFAEHHPSLSPSSPPQFPLEPQQTLHHQHPFPMHYSLLEAPLVLELSLF